MKALVLKRYGGLDQVAFADIARPALEPDEILVRVHAVGLNPVDTVIPKGTFKPFLRFQLPATLGSDLERISNLRKAETAFAAALPAHNPNDGAMVEVFATFPKPKT